MYTHPHKYSHCFNSNFPRQPVTPLILSAVTLIPSIFILPGHATTLSAHVVCCTIPHSLSTCRHLCLADQGDLVVPWTRTAGFGPRSFSVAGPLAWNSLPPEVKTWSLTLGQFSGRLKTEMFLCSYYMHDTAVVIFCYKTAWNINPVTELNINWHPMGFWGRSLYRLDAIRAAQPTMLKNWRHRCMHIIDK